MENLPTIPTKESDLTHDMGYLTEHQSLANYYTKSQVDTQITGVEAEIPTTTSDLVNDSGYITSGYHDNTKQDNLTAGRNITINNNVISATSSISVDYGTLTNKPSINGVTLTGNKTTSDLQIDPLPPVTSADNGKVLMVVNGEWQEQEPFFDYRSYSNKPSINSVTLNGDVDLSILPSVTSADDGKILIVRNGQYVIGEF